MSNGVVNAVQRGGRAAEDAVNQLVVLIFKLERATTRMAALRTAPIWHVIAARICMPRLAVNAVAGTAMAASRA